MTTVVISPSNVVTFPEGGGHFWVYMQYVQGLRQLGCEVYWLERFQGSSAQPRDALTLSTFFKRMERYGLGDKVILYASQDSIPGDGKKTYEYIGTVQSQAEGVFKQADLLLNFHYNIDPILLSYFQRTALVDIDPGLLQFWINTGQLFVFSHHHYFSIGETVGTPIAKFPDCGLPWIRIRPPVCLELWPYMYDPNCEAFTTVSGWWGGDGKGEFITDGKEIFYENNKRVSFLKFMELPRLTTQVLELALCLGEGDTEDEQAQENHVWQLTNSCPSDITDYKGDAEDRKILENHGWRLRHSYEVAASPEMYQLYIQKSRGEFSCAKPSCLRFQNAWISDRTLCYLASGKPVVVQYTGSSYFLPNGEGMFRFSTLEEAVDAFAIINADYKKNCQAAREIAETYFDAKQILEEILNVVCK
jgi:hypothetical protein